MEPPARKRSALAKIERAGEHCDQLRREIDQWLEARPLALRLLANADRSRWEFVVASFTPPPLDRWGLIAGDAAHNLRTSLEHVFFELADAHIASARAANDDPRNRAFPIFGTKNEFVKFRRRREHLLSPVVWDAIEQEQPYSIEDRQSADRLLLLRDLDNTDKHRNLNIMTMWTPRLSIDAALKGPMAGSVFAGFNRDILEGRATPRPGDSLAEIRFPAPGQHVDDGLSLECEVTIGGGYRHEVTHLLAQFGSQVRGIVDRVLAAAKSPSSGETAS